MPAPLDLNLLTVARYAGQEYPQLLGLHVSEPPRHAARGRTSDRIILYLATLGNAPLPPGKQEKALADLAKLYFNTPGSATAAMRAVADELNKLLLERNLQISNSSRQGLGLLTQVVLRGEQLYLALSGPVHAFLITASETRDFYDLETADRSLGQGRATPISYFQTSLQANDTLLLAAQPSPAWNESVLTGIHGQGPESLRRRLFNPGETDLNAVLVQARTGKGKFYLLRASAGPEVKTSSEAGPKQSQPADRSPIPAAVAIKTVAHTGQPGVAVAENPASPDANFSQAQVPIEAALGVHQGYPANSMEPEAGFLPIPDQAVQQPGQKNAAPGKAEAVPTKVKGAAVGASVIGFIGHAGTSLHSFLSRMMPDEASLNLPSYLMAFIAIMIPVLVVAVASVVYFRLGRIAQYDLLYSQAKQMALQASGQTDLSAKRANLQTTLEILQRAEAYQITPDTQGLRLEVRGALDSLELIRRISYQPAIIGGLPETVSVARMVVSDNDLYMLDGNSGNVYHASMTDQGYKVDMTFQCGPSVSGAANSGPLVDIAIWPPSYKPIANLIGIDPSGNVLYCQSKDPPSIDKLTAPSVQSWGKIVTFALDGDLYVLDLPSNSVWIYWRSNFNKEPTQFFDQEIPKLDDVIDLAANNNDLYLLHNDGHLTLCVYTGIGVAPNRCSDPAYIDFRPGRENLSLAPPAPFSQMVISLPPDPSLFMLEPKSQAIYHFSLRNLAFQRQILPDSPLSSGAATAFTVDTIRRNVFLAIGNQVFYGVLP